MKLAPGVWDRRENNFDFIRLALAVLVIYSHAYPLGTGSERLEPLLRFTRGQMTFGAVAVNLFFIMSGFLITASAERSHGIFAFLKKRVARIYPAFLAVTFLSFLVFLPLSGGHFVHPTALGRIADFTQRTLRLQEFSSVGAFAHNPYPNVINGSIWSIQFEFWCYIGVALLLSVGLLRQRALLLAIYVASIAVSVFSAVGGIGWDGGLAAAAFGSPQLWARLLPLYLAGVVFYLYRDRIALRTSFAVISLVLLLAAARIPYAESVVFPVAGTYLVFFLAFTPWIRLHHFGRFGDFSYGTYLYAFPIEQLLMSGFGRVVAPWLLFVCALPLTLFAALVSWYAIERRFLQPGRRKEVLAPVAELEKQHA